jgi:enamine deaminase RidA (YjgF/YER057c/UK114 family)
MTKIRYPAHPEVPISKAVRAGDFVFTSAYGPWTFDPRNVVFDAAGAVVDDGAGHAGMDFASQVHATFGFIGDALGVAGCTLADVVECEVWLADARDFVRFNEIYLTYFAENPPTRSVFQAVFMFACKLEMRVRAYRPQMQ